MADGLYMLNANNVQDQQPYNFNLKGEGINVGIWDEGVIGTHADLPINQNFVVDKEENNQYLYHPTFVGGCLGGNGIICNKYKGIAPKANIYYWDVLNDIIQEIEDGKNLYSVDISNHSYNFSRTTCTESGTYIPEADLDKLVYNNPTLLPFVASGNSANSLCSILQGYHSLDIGFQGCKNAITVGWLYANETIAEGSGRGPTNDGRIKPELVSKGHSMVAPVPINSYFTAYGSSFSSPQVAGLAALVYQKYKQQFNTIPNAALVKAILCNTAHDLGNPGPDYTFGFGKPDALKAIKTLENNTFAENSVAQNELKTVSISIPSFISKLNITLCWTDKEGSPIAQNVLVNNLDLKLITPNGDTILPWVLNPSQFAANAQRGIDKINNIEQITIDNAIAGNYTILVKGTSIPFGPQNYAVAYYLQPKVIELSTPNGGEILDANSATTIRWYANGIDSMAKIEFSSNNGSTWQTVVSSISLLTQNLSYTLPAISSNQCLLKITSGTNVVQSASPFTVGTPVDYTSINHTTCDKTTTINWNSVNGASSYKIYLYNDTSWSFVAQTTQNKLYIKPSSKWKKIFVCN